MATKYKYANVFAFQKKFRSREEREKQLQKMSDDEIRHLAQTCGTVQGASYYMSFVKKA